MTLTGSPDGYAELLAEIKRRIATARVRVASVVSTELVRLYWEIGHEIRQREARHGWGAKVIDHLADDLRRAMPGTRGFSRRSLQYMRTLAGAYPDATFFDTALGGLPWGHIAVLLDSDASSREWYAKMALQEGWSQPILRHQIRTGLHRRQGKAPNNFDRVLPPSDSELTRDLLKDRYQAEFLRLEPSFLERELEDAILTHITKFMVELGRGFAFLGRQYHLNVGGDDFYVDLLFYHIRLKRLFVIDLKIEDFEPEFAGKMSFYLSVVDEQVRPAGDPPSIGLILCAGRNDTVVEYALRTQTAPIAVATYALGHPLPEPFENELPPPEAFRDLIDAEKARLVGPDTQGTTAEPKDADGS